MSGREAVIALVAIFAATGAATAQLGQADLAQAFELERGGRYEEAARQYEEALARNPANLSALLGLERVLVPLGRLASIVPRIDSALALQQGNRSIRGVQLRVLGTLGQMDALAAAARDWIVVAPDSPEPYSEWARAVAKAGDTEGAQAILAEGTRRIGDEALAQDMAELSALAGEWVPAARQWREAVSGSPSLITTATSSLLTAPTDVRPWVVDALLAGGNDTLGGRMASDLLLGWGDPLQAWTVLSSVLPTDAQLAVGMLRRFADRARQVRTSEGALARGYALEQIARFSSGPAAERARIEAARAFVEGGNKGAAERMLDQIPDGRGGAQPGTTAVAALISVMAESGRVEEAEERFAEWRDRLSPDDVAVLRDRIAWAWIGRGDLDRAAVLLAADSSVATLAVRGWVALYRGDVPGATALFREAGPLTGTRAEATRRTEMVALVQQIEVDSLPALGQAMLELRRGDTADAVGRLERLAPQLPATGGRAAVLAFAGRLAVDQRDDEAALRLLPRAIQAAPQGAPAASAHYELGRLYLLRNEPDRAREQLEFLILNFPKSAMLPLARRLLERVGRSPSS